MNQSSVLIDAHVHVYPQFDLGTLLDSAAANFRVVAERQGLKDGSWQGALLLAETARCDWFESVSVAGGRQEGDWHLSPTSGDDLTLAAKASDGRLLRLVAGRQSATVEGLEVLSLCTRARIPERQSLRETLEASREAGAVVVVPWGVGKWLGKRGSMIAQVLSDPALSVAAGDNGGRPWIWPTPAQFSLPARSDVPLISGSDPLPLRGAERAVGRFGIQLNRTAPDEGFGRSLGNLLRNARAHDVRPFGRLETVSNFLRSQIVLRLNS